MKRWLLLVLFASNCWALEQHAKIFVAGQDGVVGNALIRCLHKNGFTQIMTAPPELDLCKQAAVMRFFNQQQFDYVFLCPIQERLLSGITANTQTPAKVLSDTLYIQLNVLAVAY